MTVVQLYVEQHERDKERVAAEKQAYEVRRSRHPIALPIPHSRLTRRRMVTRTDRVYQESSILKNMLPSSDSIHLRSINCYIYRHCFDLSHHNPSQLTPQTDSHSEPIYPASCMQKLHRDPRTLPHQTILFIQRMTPNFYSLTPFNQPCLTPSIHSPERYSNAPGASRPFSLASGMRSAPCHPHRRLDQEIRHVCGGLVCSM